MTAPTATRRPPMDPRIGRRRAEVTRANGRRRLRLLVAALVVVALGGAALGVAHSPLLSARHVTVVGASQLTPAQVERVAGLQGSPPLIDVDPGAAEARLEALAWVKSASVERHWPDSVVVHIVERTAVAVVAGLAIPATFALVDGDGKVLGWTPSPPLSLPVIRSTAKAGRPGSVLGAAAAPGLAVCASLGSTLAGKVRAVTVGPGGVVSLDLGGGVQAIVGQASSLGPKLAALASILAGATPKGPETIDVTIPGEPTVGPGTASPSP